MQIQGKRIGVNHPVYLIAEMSANHGQSYERAEKILRTAKECGVDAIKLQTYTADTMTLDSKRPEFQIGGGTPWDGASLHKLYTEAHMPWEWQTKLKALADKIGLALFSSPFDATAVDFLETLAVPAYKIASFEIVDLPLIEKAARTGKPLILSTGMATEEEIGAAVTAARNAGATSLALLKCTSAYPAPYDEMNLLTIPDLAKKFGVPIGLSDHTLGTAIPVAAVALGARIIEKHFTLSRKDGGPDSAFSLEPQELAEMVKTVRQVEQSLGTVRYGVTDSQEKNLTFRRSLFVVADVRAGDPFTAQNVRAIRPGHGLKPQHLNEVLGGRAASDIKPGTPLTWDHVKKTGSKR